MVLKLSHGPPLYKPPTRQALGGALLDANASTYEEDLSERIEADAVEEHGAAIVTRRKQITPCSLAPRCVTRCTRYSGCPAHHSLPQFKPRFLLV
jgi:hypothetical protein